MDVEIFADNILVEVVAENISNKLVRLMMEWLLVEQLPVLNILHENIKD